MKWIWGEDIEWLYPLDAYLTLRITQAIFQPINLRFAEIGTWKGGWIRQLLLNNQSITGIAVDPFPGLPEIREYFLKNMESNGLQERVHLLNRLEDLEGYKFNLFHLDACHQQNDVNQELEFASKHLEDKGVICVDDIWHNLYPGVAVAVFTFLYKSDFAAFALTRNKIYLCHKDDYSTYFNFTKEIAEEMKIGYSLGVKIGDKTGEYVHTYSTSNAIHGFPVVNFTRYSNSEIARILAISQPLSRSTRLRKKLVRIIKSCIKF